MKISFLKFLILLMIPLQVFAKTFTKTFSESTTEMSQIAAPSSFSSQPRDMRYFSLSLPLLEIMGTRTMRMELNLLGDGSLTLEGQYSRESELLSKNQKKTDGSLKSTSTQASLIYTRYTNNKQMSGFYLGFGAGYRQDSNVWKAVEARPAYGLSSETSREKASEFKANGLIYQARGGYRFIGERVPILIGGFLGVRHYDVKLQKEKDDKPSTHNKNISDEKFERYKNLVTTGFEPGIEFGFAF